jgi:hypothetical protein
MPHKPDCFKSEMTLAAGSRKNVYGRVKAFDLTAVI